MSENNKIMTVYIPTYCSDMTEGRGGMSRSGFAFFLRKDAVAYIDAQPGVMGRREKWSEKKYGDWGIDEMRIYPSVTEYEKGRKQELRKEALERMSTEEREAFLDL